MLYKTLKWARITVALIFLFIISLIFLDFRDSFDKEIYQMAVAMQFVPALLKTVTVAGTVAIGLIALVILTALFGRVYCSAICPLGIFQDVVSRFSRKINKKKKYKYSKAWKITRYTFLAITILAIALGGITLVTLLDPYSLFGRIASYIFKPILVMLNNLGAEGLSKAGIYSLLYRYELHPVHTGIMLLTVSFLLAILIMSFRRGRLYCNTICPVGTLLGLLSKFALVKVAIDRSSCTKCGKCARVCKSECIDLKTQKIDYSRCVSCYNCLTVCKDNAIDYRVNGQKSIKSSGHSAVTPNLGKREFLAKSILGTATLLGLDQLAVAAPDENTSHGSTKIKEDKTSPVSPPGSKGVDHLNKICTGCSLCISACPTKVLQPAFMEYGLIGMMQPRMDFHAGLCNYDCVLCSQVCPTGAIVPLTVEQKKLTQVGRAKFIKANCIVETEGTDCGACSEHCPTKAVQMVPYGELFLPEVNEEICIGCGACEYACPTRPFRAIYVDGNKMHQPAQKPEVEKAKTDLKADEFPF